MLDGLGPHESGDANPALIQEVLLASQVPVRLPIVYAAPVIGGEDHHTVVEDSIPIDGSVIYAMLFG